MSENSLQAVGKSQAVRHVVHSVFSAPTGLGCLEILVSGSPELPHFLAKLDTNMR